MPEAILFYSISGLLLAAALAVVVSRQPIYSVLSLLMAMFCLAALFVMLGAYFVAGLQILLYAGAVLVLFLFIMMLLNLTPDPLARRSRPWAWVIGSVIAAVFCATIARLIPASGITGAVHTPSQGTVEEIGRLMFTRFAIPFELTSFLILAAMVAAVTLARDSRKRP